MSTGKAVAEEYLQVMKTEHIGLLSLVLTEKHLISLPDTTPPVSLTPSANLHLEIAFVLCFPFLQAIAYNVLFFSQKANSAWFQLPTFQMFPHSVVVTCV
ncbi:hypothetical protein E2542_SST01695 [Spatholobus suberectus]|nr:hypothetical protein E2542_SST01695 [Spatholobus suberectus]